ncbi:MAG: dynamin family protein [Actinomycetota bacterium]
MNAPDPNADVRGALELGVKAATAYERPDLAERLRANLAQVSRPEISLVAVGEFKQGKSSLVNALVNVNICPVDDDIATAVNTFVRYGPERRAHAVVKQANNPEAPPSRIPIDVKQVRSYATEQGQHDPNVQVQAVEIELPRKLLQDGIVIMDTPGVGGLGSAHAAASLKAMSLADAALFISDASQEYTRAEMDYLAQALEMCQTVICVMTKIDLYPRWRTVLDINRGHLNRLGYHGLPILPVSSSLRVEGINRKDKEINAQSGFPQLVQHITDEVVANNAMQKRVVARNDLLSVCEQLTAQFEPKRAALSDPNASADLVSSLERAKLDAEALRSQVSKWNVTLNDGVSDLTSDVDHDFRARIRTILADADQSVADHDPAAMWDEFEPWLTSSVSQATVANYRFLSERSSQLSMLVAQHFDTGQSLVVAQLEVGDAARALDRVSVEAEFEMEATGLGAMGLTVARGSMGGMIMGGFAVQGLSAIGVAAVIGTAGAIAIPALLVAAMGRKTLKDEAERALTRRRADAKNAVRRYCDEVSFQVSKDSRDTLRLVQRQLRDHYSARAEELTKSTGEALKQANSAAKVAEQDRAKQLRDVTAELERIDGLRKRAEALVPAQARA